MKLFLILIGLISFGAQADPMSECKSGTGKKCYELGIQVQGKSQLKLATALYKMGCEKKSAISCNKYGFMLDLVERKPKEAHKYFVKSCEMGYGGGCNNIADKAKRAGDKKTALKFYDLGCKKGYKRSCGDGYLLRQGIE